jgi:hypothetical protein
VAPAGALVRVGQVAGDQPWQRATPLGLNWTERKTQKNICRARRLLNVCLHHSNHLKGGAQQWFAHEVAAPWCCLSGGSESFRPVKLWGHEYNETTHSLCKARTFDAVFRFE